MLSVRDFDGPNDGPESSPRTPLGLYSEGERRKTVVWIESCEEKGYSMVSIECKDRRRLMFDTVCTLTDMQYVIFHASASAQDGYAFQVHIHIFLITHDVSYFVSYLLITLSFGTDSLIDYLSSN